MVCYLLPLNGFECSHFKLLLYLIVYLLYLEGFSNETTPSASYLRTTFLILFLWVLLEVRTRATWAVKPKPGHLLLSSKSTFKVSYRSSNDLQNHSPVGTVLKYFNSGLLTTLPSFLTLK